MTIPCSFLLHATLSTSIVVTAMYGNLATNNAKMMVGIRSVFIIPLHALRHPALDCTKIFTPCCADVRVFLRGPHPIDTSDAVAARPNSSNECLCEDTYTVAEMCRKVAPFIEAVFQQLGVTDEAGARFRAQDLKSSECKCTRHIRLLALCQIWRLRYLEMSSLASCTLRLLARNGCQQSSKS